MQKRKFFGPPMGSNRGKEEPHRERAFAVRRKRGKSARDDARKAGAKQL